MMYLEKRFKKYSFVHLVHLLVKVAFDCRSRYVCVIIFIYPYACFIPVFPKNLKWGAPNHGFSHQKIANLGDFGVHHFGSPIFWWGSQTHCTKTSLIFRRTVAVIVVYKYCEDAIAIDCSAVNMHLSMVSYLLEWSSNLGFVTAAAGGTGQFAVSILVVTFIEHCGSYMAQSQSNKLMIRNDEDFFF